MEVEVLPRNHIKTREVALQCGWVSARSSVENYRKTRTCGKPIVNAPAAGQRAHELVLQCTRHFVRQSGREIVPHIKIRTPALGREGIISGPVVDRMRKGVGS